MQIVESIDILQKTIKSWRQAGQCIAFVPTMGNLHAGHIKLVEEAKQQADRVVVSIFVNPTQFGPQEDFAAYPRTLAEDEVKLVKAEADLLFLPEVATMYKPTAQTVVTVPNLANKYCGASRPGHFDGVATIVCKLFNLVQPDRAFFGLKDYQQCLVIKTMVQDLNIPVTIHTVPIVREASGLALSSRNSYLTAEEKAVAPALYQMLLATEQAILAGHRPFSHLEQHAGEHLAELGFVPDYFSICRADNLEPAQEDDKNLVILAAARLGKARLIDNLSVNTLQ